MNKIMDTKDLNVSAPQDVPPALLFEMIRSFVSLASTLNLSHSVLDLGSTRQTVRRHISNLEEAMGAPLFDIDERRYRLSQAGENALPGAKDILARGVTWLNGQSSTIGHLQLLKAEVGDWDFYQEQQPIGQIWQDSSILLREAFRAWSMSSGHIESPFFAHVRPYFIVYRQTELGWICVEFGAKSVYVNWFGQDYARSSIGRPISQMPAGEEFSHLIYEAFDEIEATQTARLDHVFTRMPRLETDALAPVAYQRLILSGFFPDGSTSVMSLVLPVDNVRISGLSAEKLAILDPVVPIDFAEEDAIFERMDHPTQSPL